LVEVLLSITANPNDLYKIDDQSNIAAQERFYE
jgi:hypothetical protein